LAAHENIDPENECSVRVHPIALRHCAIEIVKGAHGAIPHITVPPVRGQHRQNDRHERIHSVGWCQTRGSRWKLTRTKLFHTSRMGLTCSTSRTWGASA